MGRVIGHAVRPARRTRSGREPVVAFIPVVYVQEERSSRVVEFCPRMGEPGDFVGAEGLLPWGATLDEVYQKVMLPLVAAWPVGALVSTLRLREPEAKTRRSEGLTGTIVGMLTPVVPRRGGGWDTTVVLVVVSDSDDMVFVRTWARAGLPGHLPVPAADLFEVPAYGDAIEFCEQEWQGMPCYGLPYEDADPAGDAVADGVQPPAP